MSFEILSRFSYLVPLLIGLIFRKNLKIPLIFIFYLVALNLIVSSCSVFFGEKYPNYVQILYFVNPILSFGCIGLFFAYSLKNRSFSILFYSIYSVFLGYIIYDAVENGIRPKVSFFIIHDIFVLFAALYLLKTIITTDNLFKSPIFWNCIALLFYYSYDLILCTFGDFMAVENEKLYLHFLYYLSPFFVIIFNFLLSFVLDRKSVV